MEISHSVAKDLFFRALEAGATQTAVTSVHWDISGRCSDPRTISFEGRPPSKRKHISVPTDGVPYFLDMTAKCRRCEPCLEDRRNLWFNRALSEAEFTEGRSWFVTLTVGPIWRFRAKALASLNARAAGIADLESEDQSTQFRYIARVMSPWVTNYLKRVRKMRKLDDYAAKFRYLLVAEPHKDGFPHFHLLVHEAQVDRPIRKRRITGRWSHGFASAKLLWSGAKAASYISKYIAKGMHARVRASRFYGSPRQQFVLKHSSLKATPLTAHEGGGPWTGERVPAPSTVWNFSNDKRFNSKRLSPYFHPVWGDDFQCRIRRTDDPKRSGRASGGGGPGKVVAKLDPEGFRLNLSEYNDDYSVWYSEPAPLEEIPF
jgi:hypothetical protein